MHGHEVDCFGRRFLRGHDQIALVLAVGIVGYDNDLARRDVVHDVLDRVEFKVYRGFRDHRVKVAVALWDVNALPTRDFAGGAGHIALRGDKSPDRLDAIVARSEELHCASAQKGKG